MRGEAGPSRRLAGVAGVVTCAAALALSAGCRPTGDKTSVIHRPEPDAARAIWSVEFSYEFTIPEKFRFRTEEYASIAADPQRGLIYVGSRDGSLLALDDRSGQVVWETELGGTRKSQAHWRSIIHG